ncbi:hypothetical protein KKG45_10325, partial [bacterium]|nr:hypothetical protein [bacterium]
FVDGASCANDAGCPWWGCWQYDQLPPGRYVADFVAGVAAAGGVCAETVAVKGGRWQRAPLAFAEPLVVGVPRDRSDEVVFRYELPDRIEAPLPAGEVVGRAVAELDGHDLGAVDLMVSEDVEKGGFWDRLFKR